MWRRPMRDRSRPLLSARKTSPTSVWRRSRFSAGKTSEHKGRRYNLLLEEAAAVDTAAAAVEAAAAAEAAPASDTAAAAAGAASSAEAASSSAGASSAGAVAAAGEGVAGAAGAARIWATACRGEVATPGARSEHLPIDRYRSALPQGEARGRYCSTAARKTACLRDGPSRSQWLHSQ
jgi:hypothetical protein